MTVSLNSLLTLYRFPTGRRLFALGRIRRVLEPNGFEDLRAEVERAITADRATHELEDHWRGSRGVTEHAPEATRLDAELGRALAALDETLGASLKAFGEDSPRGQSAAFARSRLFPKGVRHVTRLPFVEQQVAVATLLRRVKAERELCRQVHQLRVEEFVDRVAEVNARYVQALQVRDASTTSFPQVQEARQAGQENLSRIVFLVGARLAINGRKREAEPLWRALHAVLEQNAAIKRLRQRRRSVGDVDPETGSELGSGGDDESSEAPADSAEASAPVASEPPVASPLSVLEDDEAEAA